MDAHAPTHETHPYKHQWLERKPLIFTVLAAIAILIGGAVEMIPVAVVRSNIPTIGSVKPYSPLELQGRDLYIREGCNACHSQMIRPFRSETERYTAHIPGASELYSKPGEYVYDHPFLWGSKRTGPDLFRVGHKYPDSWHYKHMEDPRSMSPGSIMPRYPWLLANKLDTSSTPAKIRAMRRLGVPYPIAYADQANEDLKKQAETIAASLRGTGVADAQPDREIIALIAYLQRLGIDVRTDLAKAGAP